MAYHEVTMLEVKEVLRLWLGGAPKKRISAQLGLNVKTVRRYIGAARADGLARESGPEALDDGLIATVVSRVQPSVDLPHGEGWAECVAQRAVIEPHLRGGVRLSKIRTLLRRQGGGRQLRHPPALRRGRARLGRSTPTIPVADCGPGEEVQVDTGWMTHLAADPATSRRHRFRATSPHPGHPSGRGDTRIWLDRPATRGERRGTASRSGRTTILRPPCGPALTPSRERPGPGGPMLLNSRGPILLKADSLCPAAARPRLDPAHGGHLRAVAPDGQPGGRGPAGQANW
jgi:hypothetical protein